MPSGALVRSPRAIGRVDRSCKEMNASEQRRGIRVRRLALRGSSSHVGHRLRMQLLVAREGPLVN